MATLEELYELFFQNVRLHEPDADRPLCPICLRPMRLTKDRDDDAVTEGHVFPHGNGLDGGSVIECRRCNEGLGGSVDGELVQQLRLDRFNKGERSIEVLRGLMGNPTAQLQVQGLPATAKVTEHDGKPHMHVAVASPPTFTDDGNVRFDFNFRLPDFRTSLVGVLHSAYLRMFYLLGYEYVFNPNVHGLRTDLGRLAAGRIPRAEIAQHFAPYRKVMFQHQLPASWKWSHVVTTPPGCRSFLAVVRTLPGWCVMAMLPGFGKEGQRAFQRLLRKPVRRGFHICSLEISELTREERLRNVRLKAFGRQFWEDAGTHKSNLRRAMLRRERAELEST